jgi:hypothetical protein
VREHLAECRLGTQMEIRSVHSLARLIITVEPSEQKLRGQRLTLVEREMLLEERLEAED